MLPNIIEIIIKRHPSIDIQFTINLRIIILHKKSSLLHIIKLFILCKNSKYVVLSNNNNKNNFNLNILQL